MVNRKDNSDTQSRASEMEYILFMFFVASLLLIVSVGVICSFYVKIFGNQHRVVDTCSHHLTCVSFTSFSTGHEILIYSPGV